MPRTYMWYSALRATFLAATLFVVLVSLRGRPERIVPDVPRPITVGAANPLAFAQGVWRVRDVQCAAKVAAADCLALHLATIEVNGSQAKLRVGSFERDASLLARGGRVEIVTGDTQAEISLTRDHDVLTIAGDLGTATLVR